MIHYVKVPTVDAEGFMLDISAAIIELRKDWDEVGINMFDAEEEWCELACWNIKSVDA